MIQKCEAPNENWTLLQLQLESYYTMQELQDIIDVVKMFQKDAFEIWCKLSMCWYILNASFVIY